MSLHLWSVSAANPERPTASTRLPRRRRTIRSRIDQVAPAHQARRALDARIALAVWNAVLGPRCIDASGFARPVSRDRALLRRHASRDELDPGRRSSDCRRRSRSRRLEQAQRILPCLFEAHAIGLGGMEARLYVGRGAGSRTRCDSGVHLQEGGAQLFVSSYGPRLHHGRLVTRQGTNPFGSPGLSLSWLLNRHELTRSSAESVAS